MTSSNLDAARVTLKCQILQAHNDWHVLLEKRGAVFNEQLKAYLRAELDKSLATIEPALAWIEMQSASVN